MVLWEFSVCLFVGKGKEKKKKKKIRTGAVTVLVSEKNRVVCQAYPQKYFSYCNHLCHKEIMLFVKTSRTRINILLPCIFRECKRMRFVLSHIIIRWFIFRCV